MCFSNWGNGLNKIVDENILFSLVFWNMATGARFWTGACNSGNMLVVSQPFGGFKDGRWF